MLGNDGNVCGNDGLGAFRDELEALLFVRRVLQEAFFSFKPLTLDLAKGVNSELAILKEYRSQINKHFTGLYLQVCMYRLFFNH